MSKSTTGVVAVIVNLRPTQVQELNRRIAPLDRSRLIRTLIDDFLAGRITASYQFTPPAKEIRP